MEDTQEDTVRRDQVTVLLRQWHAGDRGALERLLPIVHDSLHQLAARLMRGERAGHTLEARGLINEAYLRLVDSRVEWTSRAHFLAIAARTMRRVLIDHARNRGRHKRGGEQMHVTLHEDEIAIETAGDTLLELEEALTRLAERDARKAEIAELTLFGGLSRDEVAEVLGISASAVGRDLRFARAWLQREMSN